MTDLASHYDMLHGFFLRYYGSSRQPRHALIGNSRYKRTVMQPQNRAHRVCASMTHDEYQQFSADGMVRSGSMCSHVVRCCPMCSDAVPRSPMWSDVVISQTPFCLLVYFSG